MDKIDMRKVIIMLVHALVGWAVCSAIMGIGMAVTSVENTLVAHAIGGPAFFIVISLVYFKKFSYTTPLQTAIVFLCFVVFMDVFVVAFLILNSFEMFGSILGTWIPFGLIFISTYLTGLYAMKRA